MATINNKRIEEAATTALKAALLACPILDSYIDSNDKTPSWDGNIFVYNNGEQKKCDLKGKVPIQIKGTSAALVSNTATFPCSVIDLRNYYNDGGCIFFLICVNPDKGEHKIFYSSLLVYDLKNILKKAGKQETYTIHLKKFPEGDEKEISSIFLDFVENSKKQSSFIGKELISIESLKNNNVEIEALTFNASGIGLSSENIGAHLSTHDFYLYAKPKGLDLEIPINKISDAIVTEKVNTTIAVKEKVYYESFDLVYENGNSSIKFGNTITLKISTDQETAEISIDSNRLLSDYIRDTTFFLDVCENHEIVINDEILPFSGMPDFDVEQRKVHLVFYKDVKKMLDLLGVKEELHLNELTETDINNLKGFINAVLYNKNIGFTNVDEKIFYGGFKIANLTIWILAKQLESGYYKLSSFFTPCQVTIFSAKDIKKENPIEATHFVLLRKEGFLYASNLDVDMIIEDVSKMKFHPILGEYINQVILDILSAYDEQESKNSRLLDLALFMSDWLLTEDDSTDPIHILNHFQIIKRSRKLTTSEFISVSKLTEECNDMMIRCGAWLLLDDEIEARNCFEMLTDEEKKRFLTFPICTLGNLK